MLMFVLSEKGLNRFELVLNIFFKFVFKYYISDFVLHTFALDIHILVYTHRCPFTNKKSYLTWYFVFMSA